MGKYQILVGKMIYLSHAHPNMAFVVSLINRFMHNPKVSQLQATYINLRYLKLNPNKSLQKAGYFINSMVY